MSPSCKHQSVLRRFRSNMRGSVGIMFGLAMVPLLGLTGAAVDYSRASGMRARMAQAADAAAIAAAKAPNMTKTERDKLAKAVFDANMGDTKVEGINIRITDLKGGVRVDVSADMATQFMKLVGVEKQKLDVFAEVARSEGYVEVALVLDTTYSMVNDMDGLRRASTNFINTLFSVNAGDDSLRVSVVPYVASVNPGRANLGMSYTDATADSPHHAQMLRGKRIAEMIDCDSNAKPAGWTPPKDDDDDKDKKDKKDKDDKKEAKEEKKEKEKDPYEGSGKAGEGAWLEDTLNKAASIGMELFGIKKASALGETPNTKEPLTGTMVTPGTPYVTTGAKALQPTGFKWDSRCRLSNPDKINHFDLFDRIPGALWKGCVEARPEPYDVTDDPPTADARTKFVPYFWPDEEGKKDEKTWAANNYMDDGKLPTGWEPHEAGDWEKTYSILKYDSKASAEMNEMRGPNKACPDELMRLTNDRAALLSKVQSLRVANGGGTISSEGVAWGWRTLSHKAPFADGRVSKDDQKVKKFLVLMSDGENSIGGNNPSGPVMSHYTAYGYLRDGRFDRENFQFAAKYFDDRFSKVCENAKAAGLTLMVVYFRDNNANAKNMMKNCASDNKFFYEAINAADLDRAFQAIAGEIGRLRITK